MYKIAEPSTLINGRDERTSLAVDKCVHPCLCGRQGSESNESFRPCIVWFFSYLPVSFYIVIENLSTIWSPKRQKSLFFCMLQCIKRSVLIMVFTAQDFSIAKNKYYFLLYQDFPPFSSFRSAKRIHNCRATIHIGQKRKRKKKVEGQSLHRV